MARIDNTTRQALIDARHAELCTRPDLDRHDVGCEHAECVDRCKGGLCRCAGCEAHMDDYVATLEELSPSLIADICEAHGVPAKAFWAAAGTDPIALPIGSVLAVLAEVQAEDAEDAEAIEDTSEASTDALGRRLVVLADEVDDWATADHPEAAAIIQELRSRDTDLAREWLDRAGVEAEAQRS